MSRPWMWMWTGAGCHAVAQAGCVPGPGAVVGAVCGVPVTVTEVLVEVGAGADPCLCCVQLAPELGHE